MPNRINGKISKRRTRGIPGWIIQTPTSKKGLGFFASDAEIQKGFKPKEGDEVTFLCKLVDGRRLAVDIHFKPKKAVSKVRPKLRRASFGALVIIILAFVVL